MEPARPRGAHRVLTTPVGELRDAYLFHLHRLCGLDGPGIGALPVRDFANLTDSIDEWLKHEVRLAGLRMT